MFPRKQHKSMYKLAPQTEWETICPRYHTHPFGLYSNWSRVSRQKTRSFLFHVIDANDTQLYDLGRTDDRRSPVK